MLEEKFTVYHDVYHQFRTEGKQQYCVCMGPNGEPALFKEGWKWDLTGMKDQEVKSRTSSSVQHSMGWIEAVLKHKGFPNPPLCPICFSLGSRIFLAAPLPTGLLQESSLLLDCALSRPGASPAHTGFHCHPKSSLAQGHHGCQQNCQLLPSLAAEPPSQGRSAL